MRSQNIISRFIRDETGAVMVYVSLMIVVIFAFAGMAIDMSRLSDAHTQARAAAEAAAIAGASQLDGGSDAIARATAAVQTSPLVSNDQRFADERNAKTSVTISEIRFLRDLPASDDTPIPDSMKASDSFEAEYVEVTTEILDHKNFLLPAIGIADTKTLRGVAVAGQDAAICRVTPLAICNPAEEASGSGADFDYTQWIGKQMLVKKGGANSQWAPGNFGFLDTPNGSQSAPDLADMLAATEGANECFSTKLNTKPGQVSSIRTALNTRFDIYENPFFQNEDNNPRYAPAANVTKGWVWTGPSGNKCNGYSEPGAPGALGLPRDQAFSNASGVPGGRFGNGVWDCAGYWATNHPPGVMPPTSCTSTESSTTRYDVYRHEIDNGIIPGTFGSHLEEGAPVCYSGGTVTDDPKFDRRLLHFAVMNCLEHNVGGNSNNVPAEAFVRAFLTEPVGDNGGDFDVYLEVVDVVVPGASDGALKEYVEIFR